MRKAMFQLKTKQTELWVAGSVPNEQIIRNTRKVNGKNFLGWIGISSNEGFDDWKRSVFPGRQTDGIELQNLAVEYFLGFNRKRFEFK